MALPVPRLGAGRLSLGPDQVDGRGRLRPLAAGDLRRILHAAGAEEVSAGDLAALVALSGAVRRLLRRWTPDLERLAARLSETLLEQFGHDAAARLADLWRRWFGGESSAGGEPGSSDRITAAAGAGTIDAALVEDLVVFHLAESNPAAAGLLEVLGADELREDPVYLGVVDLLSRVLGSEPGPGGTSLLDALREPARRAPGSLSGQLRWLSESWSEALDDSDQRDVLAALDLIEEETRPRFPPGPGPPEETLGAEAFVAEDEEPVAYSPDRSWMQDVVLMAKNAPVWMHQLSQETGRELTRLDEIPKAELDRMAEQGFTALWLIGIWDRSPASRRVKQLTGNPEAAGSAYSIRDYRIAEELGGEEALLALRERAWERGIRLGADMVPNHMGIDSRWVIEHPERFLSVERPPYPNYRFEGPDLSPVPWLTLQIEDHYYDRSDAAVVFRRYDRRTGDERFIYHGNDGTSMPWNDTAQLDYLRPETRSAVLDTILYVAELFPLIRFDAAMTLARRHYRRLWFPEPGKGGAIPSRSEHALPRAEFDRAMPQEFWREVVDVAAEKMPDTLLLAEAFWLMEGYFVRTLGMHRVYNSAFMNMLRDHENAGYRKLVRETLEYDPRILSRYVNFLTNPDERTAVDQFGRGDRYLGACTLLATLPGLPMFGHGQVEGYAEKYGMEYQRSYWKETPDRDLLRRHDERIFPLLRRRREFARTERFELYDFEAFRGSERVVAEDVFAFANGGADGRHLVVFHNRAAHIDGRIRRAVPVRRRPEADELEPRVTLGGDLGLRGGDHRYLRFRDRVAGRDHLRPADEVLAHGLRLSLGPYEGRVFAAFDEIEDRDGRLALLAQRMGGAGVPDLGEALADLEREPFDAALLRDVEAWARRWAAGPGAEEPGGPESRLLGTLRGSGWPQSEVTAVEGWLDEALEAVSGLTTDADTTGSEGSTAGTGPRVEAARRRLAVEPSLGAGVVAWIALALAREVRRRSAGGALAEWRPGAGSWDGLAPLETDPRRRRRAVEAARVATDLGWGGGSEVTGAEVGELLATWWASDSVRRFVEWREEGGRAWIRRGALRELVRWYAVFRGLAAPAGSGASAIAREKVAPARPETDPWRGLLSVVRRAQTWSPRAGESRAGSADDQGPDASGSTRVR